MRTISKDIRDSINNDIAITPAAVMARSAPGWANMTVLQRVERAAAEARANGTYGKPTPAPGESVSH